MEVIFREGPLRSVEMSRREGTLRPHHQSETCALVWEYALRIGHPWLVAAVEALRDREIGCGSS
jgi:hypothetical protein